MSFAIIDQNCMFIDTVVLENALEAEGVSVFMQEDDCPLQQMIPEEDNDVGIYITSKNDIAMARQCRLIRDSKQVKQWMILIVDYEHTLQTFRNIDISRFRSKLSKIDSDLLIFYDSAEALSQTIPKAMDRLKKLLSDTVVITSAGKHTGKRKTASVLQRYYPQMSFEVCEADDVVDAGEIARKIIVVGCKPTDFIIPVIEDAQFRLILLKNMVDKTPLVFSQLQKHRSAVIQNMNNNGWDLPHRFSSFYLCSMLYEEFYLDITQSDNYFEFEKYQSFVMWDKYGLPCERNKYTEVAVCDFLKNISVANRLLSKNT